MRIVKLAAKIGVISLCVLVIGYVILQKRSAEDVD